MENIIYRGDRSGLAAFLASITMDKQAIKERLESIRQSIEDENISYSEIAELQSLAEHIDPGDMLLREWAGIPEEKATSGAKAESTL